MSYEAGELRDFVETMNDAIQRIGAPPVRKKEAFLAFQKAQVENLVELERQFRDELLASSRGEPVYLAFLAFARTLSSVMSARSYFRERQVSFKDTLGEAVEANDWRVLTRYQINDRFVRWALALEDLGPRFRDLARRIERQRHEMVILLMPLAISRTRIFRGKTPPSHLTLKDQAQAAFEALLTAVSKYCPPFSSVYRSVAIGRVAASLIEQFSDTSLHFYPLDKKILYRANKLQSRMSKDVGTVSYEDMAARLNRDAIKVVDLQTGEVVDVAPADAGQGQEVRRDFTTTPEAVAELMAANAHVSSDSVGGSKAVARVAAPEEQGPGHRAEVREGLGLLRPFVLKLPLVQRKLLVLNGMWPAEEVV